MNKPIMVDSMVGDEENGHIEKEDVYPSDEVILIYCGIKGCYGVDIEIEDIFGKKLTLCKQHAEDFADILSDIIALDDKEWMVQWAHDNLKEEIAHKWDDLIRS